MNYVIAVSRMSAHNRLLYFARLYAGSAPKIANKEIKQRTLPGLITILSINYDQTQYKNIFLPLFFRSWKRRSLNVCGMNNLTLLSQVNK